MSDLDDLILAVHPYTPTAAEALAASLRKDDVRELNLLGHTPRTALSLALMDALSVGTLGNAWAVYSPYQHRYVGMYGYNRIGRTIYSLWTDLTLAQARLILRETPKRVLGLVVESGGYPLGNVVWSKHSVARKWIERSQCFDLQSPKPPFRPDCLPFTTKPVAELERLACVDH